MPRILKKKVFGDKEIKIRKLSRKDLKKIKEFQSFVNSLVAEDAMILVHKKISFKDEKRIIEGKLRRARKRKTVFLIAEHKNKIVGITSIGVGIGRQDHIGIFGISVRKNYRGIGLGKYLAEEVIKLAKKELKIKMVRLGVFPTNKIALGLYKKIGFKIVAQIPKQLQYKGELIDEVIMILYL